LSTFITNGQHYFSSLKLILSRLACCEQRSTIGKCPQSSNRKSLTPTSFVTFKTKLLFQKKGCCCY